jgi:D-alanyl-lipoteichoic acid acyltransferase DltB (MBOAT superfamily)
VVFNSLQFVWFFALVYAVYRLLPVVISAERAHRAQNWLLLVASYYFYSAWDYRFLALLLASTCVDYACGRILGATADPRKRRLLLTASIAFNLTLLGFFKYFDFFAANLQTLLAATGWHLDFVTLHVLLPIGISFYTFVTMSYVIDVYRREIEPSRNFVDFALFVAYFPHLVAGPILRATSLLPQIARPRRVTSEQMRDGAWLVAWGYFLKVFVADNLATLASHVFAAGAHPAGVNVLLGVYAFAWQIYGDFAGYSNIARGISKWMGIELIENFRFPYLALTPQEFWRNWHISLSTWLRDYLYIPLGGNRGGPGRTRRNLLITMLLGGLWHGAAWTFVLWGLYQGLLLIAYRPFEPAFAALRSRAALCLAWLVMFHLTCAGWLIFRAASVTQLADLARSLVLRFQPRAIDVRGLLAPLLLFTGPLLLVHAIEAHADDVLAVPRLRLPVRYAIYAATFYLIFLFGNFGGADFIYFQF